MCAFYTGAPMCPYGHLFFFLYASKQSCTAGTATAAGAVAADWLSLKLSVCLFALFAFVLLSACLCCTLSPLFLE